MCPDVVCLQECNELWADFFDSNDYDCIFQARPTRKDGCTIAWRRNSFKLLDESVVDFNELVDFNCGDTRYKRDNIAIVIRLRTDDGRVLLVSNTHLYWNPLRPEIKLAQMACLILKIEELVSKVPETSYILCGDMNSLPGSDVVRFIEQGMIDVTPRYTPGRFLCDKSLNRFCRWLRIMGIDTALETDEEFERRT